MALSYAIYPNKVLKKNSEIFRALVKNRNTYDLDGIIDQMVERRAGITRGEALATLELFMSEIEFILENGGVVNTPLFYAQCSISGDFKNQEDRFYPSRHKVKINLRPGKRLKALSENIKTTKVKSNVPEPLLTGFTNMGNGAKNSLLTPGVMGIVQGKRLQFDESDPEQGVFLLMEESNRSCKVEEIFKNSFSQLYIKIPGDLKPGSYQLQVRSNLKTKTLRSGTLHAKLKVG
ncbi:MAG: DUF4469 domain-containing protein [Bacteroidales bacterium]|nr:DUF4469 domain-containing protein [Bacteroidales bacterium]